MRILYFDCFAGASGDMILGALFDLGLDLKHLEAEIAKLGLAGYEISVEQVLIKGLGASRALVNIDHEHKHRHLKDIKKIIEDSDLSVSIKDKSLAIFTRLAEAEAKVHRTSVERIHFHEVGALDAIVDIVGAVAGLDALEVDQIYCSALHLGTGMVKCAHGILPVPVPAVVELTNGIPVYCTEQTGELLTPTAAAILSTLVSAFAPMPLMKVERVGYGAGTHKLEFPNLLRASVGQTPTEPIRAGNDGASIINGSIDNKETEPYGDIGESNL